MVAARSTERRTAGEGTGRVLYVQYTNPAGYPPLIHSARLLADRGFEVLLLGTEAVGHSLTFPRHRGVETRLMRFRIGGWRQKLHYLQFALWVLATAIVWRPMWVYASDPLSCPSALALRWHIGVRLIYHEHDSPSEEAARGRLLSPFMRLVMRARRAVSRRAELCVLPNDVRGEALERVAGAGEVITVWNCPPRAEVLSESRLGRSEGLKVLFHGSVTAERGLEGVINALVLVPDTVSLVIVGYETIGRPGYLDELANLAAQLGVSDRVRFKGAMSRDELMKHCVTCDVGVALMTRQSADINEVGMVGASNKPFDYLAFGLALLVTDRPDWRTAFIDPGFARGCDPASPESIADALRWFDQHPDQRLAMGERGRQRILKDWNYDTQFLPVMKRMSAGTPLDASALQTADRPEPTTTC